jgi:hypothetical protein
MRTVLLEAILKLNGFGCILYVSIRGDFDLGRDQPFLGTVSEGYPKFVYSD